MYHSDKKKPGRKNRRKLPVILSLLALVIAAAAASFRTTGLPATGDGAPGDSVTSVKAFMGVYKVLTSPRCMNCHPAGDIPLQGDDSHLHTMGAQRGLDGHGVYALK